MLFETTIRIEREFLTRTSQTKVVTANQERKGESALEECRGQSDVVLSTEKCLLMSRHNI